MRKKYIYTCVGFPGGTKVAEDVRDESSIPGSGRSPEGWDGNSLQYSCLENPRDKGAWRATVRRFAELDTAEAT